VAAGEILLGTFVNLGSPLTAEIIGSAGYDRALIDLEHGAVDEGAVLSQIQALESTPAVALVRVESAAANTTTATGDNRNLLWGTRVRFHQHCALHSYSVCLVSHSQDQKSRYHAPQSLEALFAVLLCMG
jgi:hypothetical protein